MKKRFFTLFVGVMSIIMVGSEPLSAFATTGQYDEGFYSTNNIGIYDPADIGCGTISNVSSSSSTTTTLSGSDSKQKVWNFYASKGLSAIAIAGIMGNFEQEDSQFDPAEKQNQSIAAIPDTGDGVTGYGIAQWTSLGRQAKLLAAIKAAGLSEYYGAGWGASEQDKSIPQNNPDDLDSLLATELNYSWSGDSTPISGFAAKLNAATSVDGDTGSTVIFHDTFEISADDAAKIQQRIQNAEQFLSTYGGNTSSCSANLGGVTSLKDGVAWAQKFVSDTKAKYPSTPGETTNDAADSSATRTIVYQFGHNGVLCWGASDCGWCTAASGWFVTAMTDYTYGGGNGNEVVGKLAAKGVPTGSTPQPFSIFSMQGPGAVHTGVVLGVLSDGSIITLEDNFNGKGSHAGEVAVTQYPSLKALIQSQTGGSIVFAYVGGKLKNATNINGATAQ